MIEILSSLMHYLFNPSFSLFDLIILAVTVHLIFRYRGKALPNNLRYVLYGIFGLIIAFMIWALWYAGSTSRYFDSVNGSQSADGMHDSYIR